MPPVVYSLSALGTSVPVYWTFPCWVIRIGSGNAAAGILWGLSLRKKGALREMRSRHLGRDIDHAGLHVWSFL